MSEDHDIRVQLAREYQHQYYLATRDRKRELARKRYAANPEKGREKAKRTYHRRPDKKERTRAQTAEWEARNPERVLLTAAKTRAKKAGLPFDITIEDVVFPETCPVLGIPIARCRGGPNAGSPSIDRIDPTKGYVKGNVWVISWLANSMKRDATKEQLIAFSRAMLDLLL